MKLRDVGEWRLIRMISGLIRRDPGALLPLGLDDADARRIEAGVLVLNTDFVSESTDRLPGMGLEQLARKCVVSNVSDLAAKGARVEGLLASVGVPGELKTDDLISLFRGLDDAAREHSTFLVGGDLGETPEVMIAIFAFGHVEKKLMARRGAKVGDLVAVTGHFGWTSLGLKILLGGLEVPEAIKRPALTSVYSPKAPVKEGELLSKLAMATASTDSSDGLYWSLRYIADASEVGFRIDHLPMDAKLLAFAERHAMDPLELAFRGGEEFHIVFTSDEVDWPMISKSFDKHGLRAIEIGKVVEQKRIGFKRGAEEIELEEGGWEHFRAD